MKDPRKLDGFNDVGVNGGRILLGLVVVLLDERLITAIKVSMGKLPLYMNTSRWRTT